MLGGHLPAGCATITDFAELHRAGKVRMLAIGGSTRAAGLADVPTFRDLGYDIDGMTWLGLHGPAGIPPARVERLASGVVTALRKPEIQDRLLKLGFEPTGTMSAEFVRIMQNDRVKWEPVIRASGFRED
jgi:tripartite-type tricarboxylate transporter receptor subunit TctC